MGNNDFTATAGITMEQWQKDVGKMTADIAEIRAQSERTSEKVAKIGTGLKIAAAVAATMSFVKTLIIGGREAGEMSKALSNLDRTGLEKTGDKSQEFSHKFKNAMLDVSGAISGIPLVGKVWDFFTAPITASARFQLELKGVQAEIGRNAITVDELADKLQKLGEARHTLTNKNTFFMKKGDIEELEWAIKAIDGERASIEHMAKGRSRQQATAESPAFSGSEHETKLAALRLKYEKEYIAIVERTKDVNGETTSEGMQIRTEKMMVIKEQQAAEEESIIAAKEIADIEATTEKKAAMATLYGLEGARAAAQIKLTAANKELELAHSISAEAVRAADVKATAAKFEFANAVRSAAIAEIAVERSEKEVRAKKTLFTAQMEADIASARAAQKKMQFFPPGSIGHREAQVERDASVARVRSDAFAIASAQRQAAGDTQAMDAKLSGNKMLSDLFANELSYQERIRRAIFDGNDALAKQLATQKAMSGLEIKSQWYRMTPEQKRDARREQDAQDHAIRQINAMEKNNPNSVPADGRNHISKSAALARAQIAARHGLKPADIKAMKAQDIQAQNIIVQAITATAIKPR